MYKSIIQLASIFGISRLTVRRRLEEMQASDRYPKASIIEDLGFVRVDIRAFTDYMLNRQRIKAGLKIEPYDAREMQRQLAI